MPTIIVVRHPNFFSVAPRTNMVRISATWPMLIMGAIQLTAMPTPPSGDGRAEEDAGPVEVAVVHERVGERDKPEHEDERVLEQLERLEPGEAFAGPDGGLLPRCAAA
jgi:hypothetical protein